VQFKIDGISLGNALTTAPYSYVWNTTLVSDGLHTITATAADAAGNTTVSGIITITVANQTSYSGGGISGGGGGSSVPPITTSLPTPATSPAGCTPTTAFSASTGQQCSNYVATPEVAPLPTVANKGVVITKTLSFGMTDPEVKLLQQYLNANGFIVAVSGPGSSNNETNYFGLATKAAVKKFQISENITPISGTVATETRAALASNIATTTTPLPSANTTSSSGGNISVVSKNLNVRVKASTSASIITIVHTGDKGTLITTDPTGTWDEVLFNTGIQGWVAKEYLKTY
jgi:peptidoglycan hydrolase-like protein with peptidoglycan-binding domain